MIRNFKDADTREFFETGVSRRWASIKAVAIRKLLQIEAAIHIDELRSPPGNRLEALKGDRAGQHSIRINGQFRICFVWKEGYAHAVEIVDYH
jgi:proteic killer suppression protein